MSVKAQKEKNIYSIMNKNTSESLYIAEVDPESACAVAHWPFEDCQVKEVPRQRHPTRWHEPGLFVKLLCEVCPYQRAECIKPAGTECPIRSEVPDITEWLKKVLIAHNCDHVGVDLTINDYDLHRKWVPLPKAIKELTPSP